MRQTWIALAALAATGCSGRMATIGAPQESVSAQTAVQAATMRQTRPDALTYLQHQLDVQGLQPLDVVIRFDDKERVGPGLQVRAWTSNMLEYEGRTDQSGVARLSLPTFQLAMWEVWHPGSGDWVPVVPPQPQPKPDGLGWFATILLPTGRGGEASSPGGGSDLLAPGSSSARSERYVPTVRARAEPTVLLGAEAFHWAGCPYGVGATESVTIDQAFARGRRPCRTCGGWGGPR